MKRTLLASAALSALLASSLSAGPVADFETEFRAMYASYRSALFTTNAGKPDAAAKAMAAFGEAFSNLTETYASAPPPQYEDDAAWEDTLGKVESLSDKAGEEIAAGELTEAHETLEGVRDLFGELHHRNGVVTFSDRMNAYHTAMEEVLQADISAADAATMLENAAVMEYLAAEVVANPPAEATDNAEYEKLVATFSASVEAFLTAARTGDMEQIKAAAAGLKKPYALLFVKFG